MSNSSTLPIDRSLSDAPTQTRPRIKGKEEVIHIHQLSSITGISPSDSLVSYPWDALEWSYTSAEIQ